MKRAPRPARKWLAPLLALLPPAAFLLLAG